MSLLRLPLVIAALFLVVEMGSGCAATQTKPDAPVTAKRGKKKKRARPTAPAAPITGDEQPVDEEPELVQGAVQEGVASFYADSLAGRRTASGARYDPKEATCAHRSLPFGTVLRVEEIETGKSVVCVVNDRGPFVEGRVVDVSKSVAQELGFQERGLTRVRLHVIDRQRRDI